MLRCIPTAQNKRYVLYVLKINTAFTRPVQGSRVQTLPLRLHLLELRTAHSSPQLSLNLKFFRVSATASAKPMNRDGAASISDGVFF